MNRAVDANGAGLLHDGFETCQSDNSAAKKSGRNCFNEDGPKALGIAGRYRRSQATKLYPCLRLVALDPPAGRVFLAGWIC